MDNLIAFTTEDGNIHWQYIKGGEYGEEGIRIVFKLFSSYQRREAIKTVEKTISKNDLQWIKTGNKDWTINLDELKKSFPDCAYINWLRGSVQLEPEVEKEEDVFSNKPQNNMEVLFYITRDIIRGNNMSELNLVYPNEILDSIKKFQIDYPDVSRTAFIMMKFGSTPAHKRIYESIKNVLASVGITAIRADEKQYHDDLFPNILTYIYGCKFGIAVFERIEAEDFNPNVSLEVGYVMALKKPVCLIKDKTLKTLHTDLVGKLYREFDPYDPENTISKPLLQWINDKDLIISQ